ncbi:MAG: hypothetical protein DRP49_03060 [Spirochaetes bacterium]|nr:MAG: hypothetical protein DRP49_03060 [Spirochaetota bacterium]
MSETLFLLGCGTMQLPALNIARDMGWYVVAADGNPEAEGRHLPHQFLHIDLKDTPALISAARSTRESRGLDAVFTAGTDFSLAVARIAEALGLPGHSPRAAALATDKVLMRRRFRERGVPSPDFAEIGPDDDIAALCEGIPGPWVVKPVDSMGARGVVKIESRELLADALEEARGYSFSRRALVETLVEGPEYSLDALVEDGRLIRCGLADRHIFYPPCFIEMGHTIPSTLNQNDTDRIWNVFEMGIKALGLTRGAAKGDIRLSPSGPVVGEIAARLSGGYMSGWTYPYSSGIEPTRGALRLAAGLSASTPGPSKKLVCAEKALIGIEGTVQHLDGREEALELPGVKEVFLRYTPGMFLRFPRNNVEKAGNVIAVGVDFKEAEERSMAALRKLNLVLNPSDNRTGVFLDASEPFPPDAFNIENEVELSSFLNNLWAAHAPRPSRGFPAVPNDKIFVPPPPPSSITDYTGRSIADVLDILSSLGLLRLAENSDAVVLSDFWKALIKGGLPGGRWYLEHRS